MPVTRRGEPTVYQYAAMVAGYEIGRYFEDLQEYKWDYLTMLDTFDRFLRVGYILPSKDIVAIKIPTCGIEDCRDLRSYLRGVVPMLILTEGMERR